MNNIHAAHAVLHTAPMLPYDPLGPFFAQKAGYLKRTTASSSFFFFFLNRHSVEDYLALRHMPSDFISSSSKQNLVSEIAFHFHRCFLSVPHFLLTT